MEAKERRKVDDFILYGIAAADQAVKDAGWTPQDDESRLRTGVMISSGIGLNSIAETALLILKKVAVYHRLYSRRLDKPDFRSGQYSLRI